MPFTFAYIGYDKKILEYFLNSIFEQYERIPGIRLVLAWKIEQYLNTLSAKSDLSLLELNTKTTRAKSRNIYGFLLPRWLKMHLDVDGSFDILSQKGHHIRRKIKKFNLSVEIGENREDFEFFYERMYKPYVQARHKGSAVIASYHEMFGHPCMESARIFFVTYRGQRIAGMYEQFFNGVPYLHAVGILYGSFEYLKMGAVGASYYFAIKDYKNHRIPRVNLGGTSPLLTDGLTRFKISLGGKISEFERQDSIRLKLMLLKYSPGLSAFLVNSGFIHFDRDQINCALFKDRSSEQTDPEFEKCVQMASKIDPDHLEVINITL